MRPNLTEKNMQKSTQYELSCECRINYTKLPEYPNNWKLCCIIKMMSHCNNNPKWKVKLINYWFSKVDKSYYQHNSTHNNGPFSQFQCNTMNHHDNKFPHGVSEISAPSDQTLGDWVRPFVPSGQFRPVYLVQCIV